MALILHLESATKICSVCVAEKGNVLSLRETNDEQYSHSEKIFPFIREVLAEARVKPSDLNALAVSSGPGSYTGLRIGASTAKGLCYGSGIPLIAINSLNALAVLASAKGGLICPMFDARRNEVYAGLYDIAGNEVLAPRPVVLDEYAFEDYLEKGPVLFCGAGAIKMKAIARSENAQFDLDVKVSSQGMVALAWTKFQNKSFADLVLFEPDYLKDFVPGGVVRGV